MAIALETFFDNDAAISVGALPTGLTVTWFIAAAADSNTAVHSDVSGTLTEDSGPPVLYAGVLEGSAITERLVADTQYFLVIRVAQDLRVVGSFTVRAVRLANA